jgi:diguanylate cyclase (GGDEF)-like protein
MKLTLRVVLATVLPFLLGLAIVVILFQQQLATERETLARQDEEVRSLLVERFVSEAEALSVAAGIMSGSRDTARAVMDRDINYLQQWGPLFLSSSVSRVIFIDSGGTVLFRTSDPYRFSDSAAEWPLFQAALTGEPVRGFYRLEDKLFLAAAQPILQYGEILVGVVITATPVDEDLIAKLLERTDVSLTLTVDGETFRAAEKELAVRREILIPLRTIRGRVPAEAMITFYRSAGMEVLTYLQGRLLALVLLLLAGIAAALTWTTRRYLLPYSVLVSELLQVAHGETPREAVPERFNRVFSDPHHEITLIASTVADYIATIDRNMAELERLSTTDQLTGLFNRRSMEQTLLREIGRADRYDHCGAVLIGDIDNFKSINDHLGHPEGDRVLQETARILKETTRTTDVVARWGGEEFLILLPQVDAAGTVAAAEKIRMAMEEACLVPPDLGTSSSPVGTMSIGVALYQAGSTADMVIRVADTNLYAAKERGRNQVVAPGTTV